MAKAGKYRAELLLPGDRTPFGEVVDCVGKGAYVELTVKHSDGAVKPYRIERTKEIQVC